MSAVFAEEDPYEIDKRISSENLSLTPALLPVTPEGNSHKIANGVCNGTATTPPLNNFHGTAQPEVVPLDSFRKRSEVLYTFPCYHVSKEGKLTPSFLSCTCSHMFILHELPENPNQVIIQARRALNSIVKITSKKTKPEVMTFSYGFKDEEKTVKIWHSERFIIPDSENVVKTLEKLIFNILDTFSQ